MYILHRNLESISDAAKKAKIIFIKYCSSDVRVFHEDKSLERSISSGLQKQSTDFLYIDHIARSSIGNITNLLLFSDNNGSIFVLDIPSINN